MEGDAIFFILKLAIQKYETLFTLETLDDVLFAKGGSILRRGEGVAKIGEPAQNVEERF